MKKIPKIKKVIIPSAGWGTRFLPLTKVVHKELIPVLNRPIIHHLIEEAALAGIEEVILILSPRKLEILKYFISDFKLEKELKSKNKIDLLHKVKKTNEFIKIYISIQNEQLGLGHAICMADNQLNQEPFAIILGDDLIHAQNKVALKQLIDVYEKVGSSVIGVQDVDPQEVDKYGIVLPKEKHLEKNVAFEIRGALEKPKNQKFTYSKAILGRYIFTYEIIKILKKIKIKQNEELNIVDAFEKLLKKQKIYAMDISGTRYDFGSVEGFVKAQIDYALRDEKLNHAITKHLKTKKI